MKTFSARTKFDSQRFAKSSGLTFQQLSHRALKEFIESDDVGGFHLNAIYLEAKKLWRVIVDEETRNRDRKYHEKRTHLKYEFSNCNNFFYLPFQHDSDGIPTAIPGIERDRD